MYYFGYMNYIVRPSVKDIIIYMQKLLDSDWITKECSFYVTPVKSCNISANYKWVLVGSKTIETNDSQLD